MPTAKETFAKRCYALLCKVPQGHVTTYADIAHALGCKAYRAVGNAMHRNPNAPSTPCHRVVCSNGSIGGYAFGIEAKIARLTSEGIKIADGNVLHFQQKRFRFSSTIDKKSNTNNKPCNSIRI